MGTFIQSDNPDLYARLNGYHKNLINLLGNRVKARQKGESESEGESESGSEGFPMYTQGTVAQDTLVYISRVLRETAVAESSC